MLPTTAATLPAPSSSTSLSPSAGRERPPGAARWSATPRRANPLAEDRQLDEVPHVPRPGEDRPGRGGHTGQPHLGGEHPRGAQFEEAVAVPHAAAAGGAEVLQPVHLGTVGQCDRHGVPVPEGHERDVVDGPGPASFTHLPLPTISPV